MSVRDRPSAASWRPARIGALASLAIAILALLGGLAGPADAQSAAELTWIAKYSPRNYYTDAKYGTWTAMTSCPKGYGKEGRGGAVHFSWAFP